MCYYLKNIEGLYVLLFNNFIFKFKVYRNFCIYEEGMFNNIYDSNICNSVCVYLFMYVYIYLYKFILKIGNNLEIY